MDALSDEAIERLQKLGGPAFVQKMIELFLDFGAAKTGEVALALREGDLQAAGNAAHALKSSAANVGALRIQAIAADIETRVKAGKSESLTEMAAQLEVAFDDVQPLLKAVKERLAVE